MDESPRTRWEQITGGNRGEEYATRFEQLARAGTDVHGEARFCASLVPPGSRILDAGCGTGRVATWLAELGFSCVGVDADESMLAVARRSAPHLPWHWADLSSVTAADLDGVTGFDLVVMAGNVVPLLGEGTLPRALRSLSALLVPGGLMVSGFGLDAAHLPPRCPVTSFEEYDEACRAAGLVEQRRCSTWDGDRYDPAGGYVVAVHRREGRLRS